MHYDFDNKTRFLVIYQDVTPKISSIAKYTNISERTIRHWIERLEPGEVLLEIKKGRGRKKILSEDDLDRIEEEVKANPYTISTRQ